MARDPIAAAHKTIEQCGFKPPMTPYAIAEALGIEVVSRLLSNQTSSCLLPEPQPQGPAQYIIIVNSRDPNDKQIRSVAHQLGHWIMHRSHQAAFVCGSRSNVLDIEANVFASELLSMSR